MLIPIAIIFILYFIFAVVSHGMKNDLANMKGFRLYFSRFLFLLWLVWFLIIARAILNFFAMGINTKLSRRMKNTINRLNLFLLMPVRKHYEKK